MKLSKKNIILWALLAILILGNAAAASFFYFKIKSRQPEEINNKIIVQTKKIKEEVNAVKDEVINEVKIEEEVEGEVEEDGLDDFEPQGERVVKTEREILIAWNYVRDRVKIDELFGDNRFKKIIKEYEKKHKEYDGQYFGCDMSGAGTVSDGAYINNEVYSLVCGEPGMGGYYGLRYIVVKDGNDLVVLANYSDEQIDYMKDFVVVDEGAVIKVNKNIPDKIIIPDSGISLLKGEEKKFWGFFFKVQDIKRLFSYDGENYLYKGSDNCYYVEVGDGTMIQYNFPDNFFILDFVNKDGKKNEKMYDHEVFGGCGTSECYNYSSKTKDELDEIGIAGSGREVFRAKDSEEVQESYQRIYDEEYYGFNGLKESYDDFVKDYPLLYMQDPFGDFIELKNRKYILQAECGKPVIYLYPEQEMNVRVFVMPNGGFTVTEPDYDQNDGWFVRAKPNGDLFNYKDNSNYPYLFWEGHGFGYERPKEGFVVGKNDVEGFLDEKLIKLGLIKKEADEFMEFWLPKMQEKNFYFITFMPKESFDKLAPLNVIPKPDTVIRVFMDFEGLDEEIEFTKQEIATPERNGFTVVEWGGALH